MLLGKNNNNHHFFIHCSKKGVLYVYIVESTDDDAVETVGRQNAKGLDASVCTGIEKRCNLELVCTVYCGVLFTVQTVVQKCDSIYSCSNSCAKV